MLNEIINQTAVASEAVPSASVGSALASMATTGNTLEVVIKQPRLSLQSAGSANGGGPNNATSGAPSEGLSSTAVALERARRQSRKISMMLDDEEDEGPRLKEKIREACQQFVDIFCVWDCCSLYIKLSEVLFDPFLYKIMSDRLGFRTRVILHSSIAYAWCIKIAL